MVSRIRKTHCIFIMLLCSVSLFANNRDTCQIIAAISGTVMINFVNHNPVGNPPLSGPITANFTGIVVPSPSGTFSINITTPVSGTITGTLIGTLAGTITNRTTGAFTGTFVGIASGTLAPEYGKGDVTGSINDGTSTGVVICSKDTCGKPLNCPPGIKYPYMFCNTKTGTYTSACAEDPYAYAAANSDSIYIFKSKLPLCVEQNFTWQLNFRMRSYDGVKLFNNQSVLISPTEGMVPSFEDLYIAANKWNCICNTFPEENEDCNDIWFEFEERPEVFTNNGLNPREVVAFASTPGPQSADEPNTCEPTSIGTIYINATSLFLYMDKEFPEGSMEFDSTKIPEIPFHRGWVNQYYIDNVTDDLPEEPVLKLYSLLQIAMHEIAHLLGFGHYNESGCSPELDGVMADGIGDIRTEDSVKGKIYNRTELSLHDKCMFAKLYCPTVGIAYEKLPARPIIIVAPNPAKNEVNITFEVKDGNKKVSIELTNEEGKTFGTLLSERQYDEGMHTCTAKLKQPAGAYFILIKIGNIIYSEKVIITK